MKQFTQGYTGKEQQSQDSNPGPDVESQHSFHWTLLPAWVTSHHEFSTERNTLVQLLNRDMHKGDNKE